MSAGAALLASSIKFDGTLIFQINGDGPVRLLVVECHADLSMRATAKLHDGALIAPDASMSDLVNVNGRGHCALTLDARHRLPGQKPYQGIVALEGSTIAHAVETYLRQSEQLDSRLWLSADPQTAAGLLLQKIPAEGGTAFYEPDADAWPRLTTLAATITPHELLNLGSEDIVRKLFWQEPVKTQSMLHPRFKCTCSRERVSQMLLSLGREEVVSIIEEQGVVSVVCDFCNAEQRFDAVDIGALFSINQHISATTTHLKQ